MKRLVAIILSCLLVFGLSVTCYAEAFTIDGSVLTDKLGGQGNYSLDMEKVGLLDTVPASINSLASVLFNDLLANIVAIACTVYYYCTEFPIAALLQPEISGVQSELKTGFFDGMFPLLFMAVGFSGAAWLFKRNFLRISSELGYALLVVVFATLLGSYSTSVIQTLDGFSLAVSQTVASSFGGGDVTENIWQSMVVQPWESINLGGRASEFNVNRILEKPANTDERQEYIDSLLAGAEGQNSEIAKAAFSKARAGWKLGMVLIYFIPAFLKCLMYIAFGSVQLVLRLAVIFLILCGTFFLLLSLIPQLGGKGILFKWVRNIFTCLILSALVTFLFSFMMKIDTMLYNNMGSDLLGWLIVIIMQVLIMLAVVVFRKQIIKMFVGLAQGRAAVDATPVHITGHGGYNQAGDADASPQGTTAQVRSTLASAGSSMIDAYADRIEQRQTAAETVRQTTSTAPATAAQEATPQEERQTTAQPANVVYLDDYRKAAAASEAAAATDTPAPEYKPQPVRLSEARQASNTGSRSAAQQIRSVTNSNEQ